MPKKLAVLGTSLTLAAALVMPLSASAAALTQTQIDSVVSLLRAFDVDESTIASINDSLGGKALTTTSSSCVDLTYNMTLGSTGSDVTNLQNYLIDGGYLASGYNTGYYGYLTASAAGKMQIALGIVTSASDSAYGIVGPVTREAIACGTTLSSSASIDSRSLTTTSSHPLITGTATNVKTIGLSISTSGGDKFDGTGTFSVVNGRWSVTLNNEVYTPGTYGIKVYDGSNNFLTSGTLNVTTNSTLDSVIIYNFSVDDTSASSGQAVKFSWSSNLTSTNISNGGGCSIEGITQNNVALQVTPGLYGASGSVTYAPSATATYTLYCYSSGKEESVATKQLIVTVKSPQTDPVLISSFTASASSVASGQPVTFSWDSNLTSTDISYGGFCSISALTPYNQQIHIINGAGASGSVTYTPALTATYTLTCSSGGKDGSPMDTEEVTVPVKG